MARSSKIDYCFLCDSIPCACGKTVRVSTRKAVQARTESVLVEKPKAFDAMRTAAKRPLPSPPKEKVISHKLSEEDLAFHSAVQTCVVLLGAVFLENSDRLKYRMILSGEISPPLRAYRWRMRGGFDGNF